MKIPFQILKNKNNKLLFLPVVILLMAFVLAPAEDTDDSASANSVVVVHTPGGSGYGVAYGGPGKIVTALHLVAGKGQEIEVIWNGQKSPAVVEKIHHTADLALLRTNLTTIPQLPLYPGNAPMRTDINYWESRPGSRAMNNKTTKLQRYMPLQYLNRRLDARAFAQSLCKAGNVNYPSISTNVFKFEEANIKKAHSGSPITSGGRVIGLVDGGDNINGKSCVWAIPAAEIYNLVQSGTAPVANMPVCNSQKLYSGLRSDNPYLSTEEQQFAAAMEASDVGTGRSSLSITFIAPFEVIFEDLFEEDKEDFLDIIADDFDIEDFTGQLISIYQDAYTGATILVPYNSSLTPESLGDGGSTISVKSPKGLIYMDVISGILGEGVSAQQIISSMKASIIEDQEFYWEMEPDEEDLIDNFLDDPEDPYLSIDMVRVAYDDSDDIIAELFANLTVEGEDVLGTVVRAKDFEALDNDPSELYYYYLLEFCAYLTDFSYY